MKKYKFGVLGAGNMGTAIEMCIRDRYQTAQPLIYL